MRPAQRARQRLKGNWLTANAVQCTQLAFGLLVLLFELAALRLLGLGAEKVVEAGDLWTGGWLYGAVLLGALLLDWLLVSPIRAGQALYYLRLAETRGEGLPPDVDKAATREILPSAPPAPSEEKPSYLLVFSFFRQGYGRALRWRLGLFCRRLGWGTLCYAPAALIGGYRELLRRGGSHTPLADMTMLLCTFLGLAALIAGFIILEMLMLRYLPAQYLLAGPPEKHLFRRAHRIMHARLGQTVGLYLGFAGWLAACFVLLPYFYAAPLFQTTRALTVLGFLRHEKPQTERERKKSAGAGKKAVRKRVPAPAGGQES